MHTDQHRSRRWYFFPLLFFVVGVLLKVAAIAAFRLWQPEWVPGLALTMDPLGVMLANRVTWLFFPRGIAPDGEALLFECALVIVFGIECLLAGIVFDRARRALGFASPTR